MTERLMKQSAGLRELRKFSATDQVDVELLARYACTEMSTRAWPHGGNGVAQGERSAVVGEALAHGPLGEDGAATCCYVADAEVCPAHLVGAVGALVPYAPRASS